MASAESKEKAIKLLNDFYQNKADQKLCKINSVANAVMGFAALISGVATNSNALFGMGGLILAKASWDDAFSKVASNKADTANENLMKLIEEQDITIPDELYDIQKTVSEQNAKDEFIGIGFRLTNAVFKNRLNERCNCEKLDSLKEEFVHPSMAM